MKKPYIPRGREKTYKCNHSSSSNEGWLYKVSKKRSTEQSTKGGRKPLQRVLFDEHSRPSFYAGTGKASRHKDMGPTPPKKRHYVNNDSFAEENIQPTKKASAFRRGLKIYSPNALRVPLANSTAYSISNGLTEDHVSDNEKILHMKQIIQLFKEQANQIHEVKAMLQTIVMDRAGKNIVVSSPIAENPVPAASSDCQIIAYFESPNFVSPTCAPGSSKKIVSRSPNSDPTMLVDASDFMNWLRSASSSKGSQSMLLPSAVVRSGDYQWFKELKDSRFCLRDEHMDVLINWMLVKYDMETAGRDWSVLEMWCWGGLTQEDFTKCEDDMMPYVRGSYPLKGGRAWHTIDKVYGFGHIPGLPKEDHWVGFEICFEKQCITVVDSMHLGSEQIGRYFEPMRRHVPRLCEKIGVWEKKEYTDEMCDCWEVIYEEGNPRQEPNDKTNCGILVMKSLEAMACGESFSTIMPDKCSLYRLRYCVDLYEHSLLLQED